MKISILTPSFNQGQFIEKNIHSVLNQNWEDVEHIIVDGGSTDNTVTTLKKYPHIKWISETDAGQADALNKGLKMATGDIIGWINSDDYYREDIFKEVVEIFQYEKVKWVIGNITYLYPSLNIEYTMKSHEISYTNLLKHPDIVKQQATFFRKELLLTVGGWNRKYYMAMDYDLWVRLAKHWAPVMINRQWAFFTHHENQKTSSKNLLLQISDIRDILQRENLSQGNILKVVSKKYFYILKAIIKKRLIRFNIIDQKYSNIPLSSLKLKK